MKLLILGGTVFLGRHLVEEALTRGHEVTLFNRGIHGPELYPEVEKLYGDRNGDLSQLEGRTWDAAIDTNGYTPASVYALGKLLSGAAKHYTFVSSISVYADFHEIGMDESAPVGTLTPEQLAEVEDMDATSVTSSKNFAEWYGPLKALCEQAAEEAMPGRVLNVRPGLIVGPFDGTDRFTYWPRRIAQGGEVLAPGRSERQIQFIDVRDLASWMLDMIERQQTGVYNATGPAEAITMGRLLAGCQAVSNSHSTLTWVDDDFLLKHEVGPWMELPLWIPETQEDMRGFMAKSNNKAVQAGLTFRPLEETIRATLAWDQTRPSATEYKAGLARERERELLHIWHQE